MIKLRKFESFIDQAEETTDETENNVVDTDSTGKESTNPPTNNNDNSSSNSSYLDVVGKCQTALSHYLSGKDQKLINSLESIIDFCQLYHNEKERGNDSSELKSMVNSGISRALDTLKSYSNNDFIGECVQAAQNLSK